MSFFFDLVYIIILVFSLISGLALGIIRTLLITALTIFSFTCAWYLHEYHPYYLSMFGFREATSKLILFMGTYIFIKGLFTQPIRISKRLAIKNQELLYTLLSGLLGSINGFFNAIFFRTVIVENIPMISEKISTAYLLEQIIMFQEFYEIIFNQFFNKIF